MGLVSFWGPVVTRKGGVTHRRIGLVFNVAMMITASFALLISVLSLIAPLETHPLLNDEVLVRAQFGWLMLYLALLTMSLTWHGLQSVRLKKSHAGHRNARSVLLHVSVFLAALNCTYQGWQVQKTLLEWVGLVGCLSSSTILYFIFSRSPAKTEYLHFHVRSAVGAGISAYTAFLSVSLVRTMPEETFNPWLWAIPTLLGSCIIGYHEARLFIARYRGVGRATRVTPRM